MLYYQTLNANGTGLSTLYNFRWDNPSALIIQDSTTYSTLIHGIFPGSEIKSDALLSKSNVITAGVTNKENFVSTSYINEDNISNLSPC